MQTALLLQMLAARRGGGSANLTELMTQLQSGGLSATGSTSDVMHQLAQHNPMLGQILQQLERGNSAAHEGNIVDAEAIEVPSRPPETLQALTLQGSEPPALSAQLEALTAELELVRSRVDRCAAALGACGACWGTDPSCRACRGRGWPGYSMPDEGLFEELIVPAIRMMKMQRAARPAGNELKTVASAT